MGSVRNKGQRLGPYRPQVPVLCGKVICNAGVKLCAVYVHSILAIDGEIA
jgi:hypothetical protein